MTEGETEVRGNVPAFSFAGSDTHKLSDGKKDPNETIGLIANQDEVQREIDLVHSNNNKDDNGKDEDQTNKRTQEEISEETEDHASKKADQPVAPVGALGFLVEQGSAASNESSSYTFGSSDEDKMSDDKKGPQRNN